MPMTINGIGTMYYGKRNLRTHPGVCESCKRAAQLSDYETTLFFVVLYIPLIPLGRKQLLNACSNCRRHAVLPAKRWQQIKQSTLEESTTALAEQLDRPEAALQHLHTLAGFGEMDEARDLAEAMENQYAKAAAVLFSLGAWHEQCGNKVDADRCFQSAYRLEPENPAMIRAQGLTLMEQGQLDEARGLLSKLAPPHPNFDPTIFSTLGKAFQQRERHAEALELFAIAAQTPGMRENKTFQQLVRISERATGRQQDSLVPRTRLWQRSSVRAAAAIGMILGLWWLLTWVRGQNRAVQIINSTKGVLEVQIDGGPSLNVQPNSYLPVKLAEGTHRVTIVRPEVAAGEKAFAFQTPLWQRAFVTPCCVLDPLESSLVSWEKVWYYEQPNDANDESVYHYGQLYVQYPGVNYLFRDFPAEIRLRRGRPASRTGINFAPLKVDMLESSGLRGNELLDRAERLLAIGGFSTDEAFAYLTACEDAGQLPRAVGYFESLIVRRPLLTGIHRLYMGLIRTDETAREKLVTAYDAELKQGQSTADLLYLRSCLEVTYPKARDFLLAALKANPIHKDSLRRKAYLEYCLGNYVAAVELMDQSPQVFADWSNRDELFFAAGRSEQLAPNVNNQPDSLSRLTVVCRIFQEQGLRFAEPPRTEEQKQILSSVKSSRPELRNIAWDTSGGLEGVAKQMLSSDEFWQLAIFGAYLDCDSEKFSTLLRTPPPDQVNGYWSFIQELEHGSQINLAKIVSEWEDDVEIEDELLMAIRFKLDGDAEQADSWLENAMKRLAVDGPSERRWAELLRSCRSEEISVMEIRDLLDAPEDKAIFATALAAFSAAPSDELIGLSRRLNYSPGPPQQFLESALKKLADRE